MLPGVSRWTVDDLPDLDGRTVLVTGANSGLGFRSAEALAARGARVLMACRNREKGANAVDDVARHAGGAPPELIALDLADLASVEAAAAYVAKRTDHLDGLLNNAGVMALPKHQTKDGFESQFGTNHLGHYALTGRLLPLLLAAPAPRVVTTSSAFHRLGRMRWDDLQHERSYQRWLAYGQSKLANLLFAFELDRRAREAGTNLVSVAAHPGYAATHLQTAGPEMAGSRINARVMTLANRVFAQSDADGALPQLRALTDPEVHGGEYLGPQGIAEVRGGAGRVKAMGAAYDGPAARRLWDISAELTGVTYDWP
jgi:NAD(P)-dependent dehydrogenase (short-subunit alcohol dehydrogenase family)